MAFADDLESLREQIDPSLSVAYANVRNLLAMAMTELAAAPPAVEMAIARLLRRYDEKQAERYTIREGLSISFSEVTAQKLAGVATVAQALVATGQGTATVWVDDGPTRLDLAAQEVLDHSADYTVQYASRLAWVSAKRQEIEAAEDPLAVELD